MRLYLSFGYLLVVSTTCFAYSPFKSALDQKKNLYIQSGVITGGRAGTGSSLLRVRRVFSAKNQVERVILDMGDKDLKPTGPQLGYFQAAVDSKQNRLVLDLAQLRFSKVTEAQLQTLFSRDAFVSSAELTLDPEDKAGTLVLNFKRPVRVEVFQLLKDKQPGRIVVDVTPASPARVR